MLRSIAILLLVVGPVWPAEETVFKADLRADQVAGIRDLGSLKVEGVGKVNLTATRDGTRIIVQAVKADGTVAGRAESVVGVNETPIYVQTPEGLKKLTILWKAD